MTLNRCQQEEITESETGYDCCLQRKNYPQMIHKYSETINKLMHKIINGNRRNKEYS